MGQATLAVGRRPAIQQEPSLVTPTDGSCHTDGGPMRSDRQVFERKWYTVADVAQMLGYGLTKTKMLVIRGELRSLKDGRSRRILPEWVDEYVARRAAEAEQAFGRWSA